MHCHIYYFVFMYQYWKSTDRRVNSFSIAPVTLTCPTLFFSPLFFFVFTSLIFFSHIFFLFISLNFTILHFVTFFACLVSSFLFFPFFLFYSFILFSFNSFYSILFYSILFCSIFFYSILSCSILFYSFILFSFNSFYFIFILIIISCIKVNSDSQLKDANWRLQQLQTQYDFLVSKTSAQGDAFKDSEDKIEASTYTQFFYAYISYFTSSLWLYWYFSSINVVYVIIHDWI